jgi:hypothetical protein
MSRNKIFVQLNLVHKLTLHLIKIRLSIYAHPRRSAKPSPTSGFRIKFILSVLLTWAQISH